MLGYIMPNCRVSTVMPMRLGSLVGSSSLKASHRVKYDPVTTTIYLYIVEILGLISSKFWKPNQFQTNQPNNRKEEKYLTVA